MTAPPTKVVPPVVALAIRVLTLICIFISLIVLTTNKSQGVKFDFFYAHRYLLSTIIFGFIYTVVQTGLSVLEVATNNQLGGDLRVHIDYFGGKIISIFLATGAAASFGMTEEIRRFGLDSEGSKFIDQANAAASLCFIAFVFCSVSSTISAYSLPKRA